MFKQRALVGAIAAIALLVGASPVGAGSSSTGDAKRYLVVFAGDYAVDSTYAVGGGYAVLCNYAVLNGYAVTCDYAVAHDYAVSLVETAGGAVTSDMLGQIGVLVVESTNALFADVVGTYAVVQDVGQDFAAAGVPDGGPEQTADPLEAVQWDMEQIEAPAAHDVQAGARSVEVGILDTGIDGAHVDFLGRDGTSNVDCAKGRDSVVHVAGGGPGVGVPGAPCVDNGFHGTHVAGIVGARSARTDYRGVAQAATDPIALPAGVHEIRASFAGDPFWQPSAVAAFVVVTGPGAPVLGAGGKVAAGGWFLPDGSPATSPKPRAYFAFHAAGSVAPLGELRYRDASAGVDLTLVAYTALVVDGDQATLTGSARRSDGGTESFDLTVGDRGEPGRSDTIRLRLLQSGYERSGALGGGNIQIQGG